MTHASTADAPFAAPGNLIRLSVGIESVEDLLEDLELALVRTPRGSRRLSPDPIDLHHQGTERVIGSYLVETRDGPAIFDCGPASTSTRCGRGSRARRSSSRDVRHLLLSHIHLDHAGAAGAIVREHPE